MKQNLEHLLNTYGELTSVDNVQMKDGRFYITASTETHKNIYFVTGGEDEAYRYSPNALRWNSHICVGLEILNTVPPIISQKTFGRSDKSKQMFTKYGDILSINILHHWKYYVDGQIFVQNRTTPLSVRLSTCYDEFLDINTFDLSWDTLYPVDQIPYVYESD